MSSLLIYRNTKNSNSVSNYSSNLSGEELDKFNSYKEAVGILLRTHSGSFYKKDYDNFYDVTYKFDNSQNAMNFYSDLESADVSNTILEYKNFKNNNGNNIVTKIQVTIKDSSANTSVTLKTINL